MKYKYRNREFWCRGYYVDTAGKNTTKIKEYIANQLKEDKLTAKGGLWVSDFAKLASEGYALKLKTTS